jgi:hypothetical protein
MDTSLKKPIVSRVNWPRGISDHGIRTWERKRVRSLGAGPLNNVFPPRSRKMIIEVSETPSSKCSRAEASQL